MYFIYILLCYISFFIGTTLTSRVLNSLSLKTVTQTQKNSFSELQSRQVNNSLSLLNFENDQQFSLEKYSNWLSSLDRT